MGPAKGRDVDQAELRLRLSASLDEARRELIDATERGEGGRAALARHAECIDGIVRELVDSARAQTQAPLAVCAVGGYGRKSQFLHSDIDLLVVFGGPIGRPEERFVKALLHPLWDLRFQVGHHVRELADFDRLDTTNPEYLLALMDLRPLAGDRDLIDRLEAVMKSSAPAWRPQILDALVTLTDQRHSEFHDTLYQLEPDVKDGPGALRDVWATRMMLRLGGDRRRVARGASPDRLSDAEEFLMRIRSGLHVDTGRNVNVLSYELQEKAVDRLRYTGPDMRRRVEALMTDYFKDARSVTRALGRVRRAALPPAADADSADRREPDVGGRRHHVCRCRERGGGAGRMAARVRGRGLAQRAGGRRCARADGARAADSTTTRPRCFTRRRNISTGILQFMRPRPGLSARLSEMRDCGLLGAIFPELNEISCRVTRDFYHKYTVDEHTLLTVRNAERLLNNPRFAPILRELHAPELLVLALLYHDVGKAREGDHSIVGAEMAAGMSRAPRASTMTRAQTIDFLIRHHLKMSRIAFRRDTEEPEVVRQFASMFGTEEHLKMLVLLTLVRRRRRQPGHADAVEGRAALAAVRRRLQPDDPRLRRRHHRSRPGAGRGAAGEPAAPTSPKPRWRRFLEGLPRRYLILFSQDAIYRHVRLSRDIRPERGALLPREEGRGVGADRRLARQAVPVLEHLRRAGVLRHGHSARARADQPGRARAGRVSVCRRRRVFRAQLGRPARSSIAGCTKW